MISLPKGWGLVPSPEWKRQTQGEPWYSGETVSVAIGQGYVTVTPLQMAKVIATIANHGISVQPHVVRGVRGRTHEWLERRSPTQAPPLTLPSSHLQVIQTALAAVVTDGTAKRAQSSMTTIAGKTGTAQVVTLRADSEEDLPMRFRDHAWFVAYAPFDDPRIAVAVLLEHMGHGGSSSAPLAQELIEAYLSYGETEQEEPLARPSPETMKKERRRHG